MQLAVGGEGAGPPGGGPRRGVRYDTVEMLSAVARLRQPLNSYRDVGTTTNSLFRKAHPEMQRIVSRFWGTVY